MNAVLTPPARRRVAPQAATRPRSHERMTEAEYLAFERDPARSRERKSELFAGGEVREMPGVRFAHGMIVDNLAGEVRPLHGDAFCGVSGEVKFRPPACRYFYPDYMALPYPPEMLDGENDVVRNPVFVAEVLSSSTADVDRGEKRVCYLATPSVLEYWLIAQDAVRVERHHRDPGGTWRDDVYDEPAGSVPLPPLGGAVSLAALYRRALPAA